MNGISKSIFASVTFWGIVIGFVSQLAGRLGYHVPTDTAGLANDIAGIAGAIIALLGRFIAVQPVHMISPLPGNQNGFALVRMLIVLAFAAAVLVGITGCVTAPSGSAQVVMPKGATQTVYAAEQSLTVATNALADLNHAGIVVGANYATAYEIQKRAHATLIEARNAATAKDATRTEVLLHTLSGLIDQIALYNGGRK